MALPNLTLEQRQVALAKAAWARRDRVELLAAVKCGLLTPTCGTRVARLMGLPLTCHALVNQEQGAG